MRPGEDLCELGVDASRKDLVVLKHRPDPGEVQLVNIERAVVPTEHHGVRVPHAHCGHCPRDAIDDDRLSNGRPRLVVGFQGGGHLHRVQDRLAHVHADLAIFKDGGLNESCKRVHLVQGGRLTVQVGHEACQAANPVATHLWLAPVAVEDPHRVVGVPDGGESEDHAVGSNPKVAVTHRHGLLGCYLGLRGVTVVHQNEVVSQALVLPEGHCRSHRIGCYRARTGRSPLLGTEAGAARTCNDEGCAS
mmetsp:Transcript_23508/g.65185  ORF Transcript_23508/g.65185 Transcript_23508/m.65185 type:complete len:248 (-) Transcript_23508:136-879(-)